ncbi:MAG TPA: response regulator [Gammaproteobacteria bacterium]|nr:response regulator [Gammaproteobacteria bacterium]
MPDIRPDAGEASAAPAEPVPPQLLDQVAEIRELWARQREHWTSEVTEQVHERLHTLTQAAEAEGLAELAEAAFSAEVYLSSFVGIDTAMTLEQREAFDALLAALPGPSPEMAEAGAVVAPDGRELYVIGRRTGPLAEAAALLEKAGFVVHRLEDPESAERALRQGLPAAIVADVESIPALEGLIEALARIHKETGRHVPLAYVASEGDLETRVKAVRAGGDAFFSPPFDGRQIAERLQSLVALHSPGNRYRVLVVEDDASQAEFATSILAKAGMEAQSVTDPMAVLDALHSFRPHLILMDIYMPEINGIELTTVIREYDEFVDIPIVFLSGEQDADKQVDALSVGGDDFITKPIRPRQLIAVVRNRLRRSRVQPGCGPGREEGVHLLDKRQFFDRIAGQLAADPMRTQATGVLLLAPDGMETLRRRLGEEGSRRLLERLAATLAPELGGDDSLALLDDCCLAILVRRATANLVHDLESRLHERVAERPFPVGEEERHLTAAIGVALANDTRSDPASLVNRARLALEYALNEGPGKTITHDEQFEALLASGVDPRVKEDDITRNIRQCLREDGFTLLYQPMLDLVERGAETWDLKLRMPTPTGELLAYREFRKEAERAGLAGDIDRWLVSRALDILQRRKDKGNRTTRLFAAQSVSTLLSPGYPDWLSGELRERRMVGTGLVLEFRLSALSHDLKAAKTAIARLREMDIQVCLSHFAEKKAAFKVLRYVRGRYIRIAPRLLKADRETIAMVIANAHKSGAKVIVSHIDDPRAIDLHWSSGADILEGDFIQQPLDSMDYDFTQVVI